MALMSPGYWPDTYYADRYFADDFWPDWGSGGIPVPPDPRYVEAGLNMRRVEIGFRAKRTVSIEFKGI